MIFEFKTTFLEINQVPCSNVLWTVGLKDFTKVQTDSTANLSTKYDCLGHRRFNFSCSSGKKTQNHQQQEYSHQSQKKTKLKHWNRLIDRMA